MELFLEPIAVPASIEQLYIVTVFHFDTCCFIDFIRREMKIEYLIDNFVITLQCFLLRKNKNIR